MASAAPDGMLDWDMGTSFDVSTLTQPCARSGLSPYLRRASPGTPPTPPTGAAVGRLRATVRRGDQRVWTPLGSWLGGAFVERLVDALLEWTKGACGVRVARADPLDGALTRASYCLRRLRRGGAGASKPTAGTALPPPRLACS
jgi:hypothetical protein